MKRLFLVLIFTISSGHLHAGRGKAVGEAAQYFLKKFIGRCDSDISMRDFDDMNIDLRRLDDMKIEVPKGMTHPGDVAKLKAERYMSQLENQGFFQKSPELQTPLFESYFKNILMIFSNGQATKHDLFMIKDQIRSTFAGEVASLKRYMDNPPTKPSMMPDFYDGIRWHKSQVQHLRALKEAIEGVAEAFKP